MKNLKFLILPLVLLFLIACNKDDEPDNQVSFKFKFDPTQERLGNFGEPASIPAGNAGQTPRFNGMTAHYVELAPSQFTMVGEGVVLYKAPETTKGGNNAIDFDKAVVKGEGETFLTLPLDNIPPGTYNFLRVSLGYQNYDIDFNAVGQTWEGTVASFVGYETYITSFKVDEKTHTVNSNKKQGYWAFETHNVPTPYDDVIDGQAPGTTVVNPIHNTSPIPTGSCLVTGAFDPPLEITGNESSLEITVSLSTNKSFEWKDDNGNGKWDTDQNEQVVDMGLRGLKGYFTKK